MKYYHYDYKQQAFILDGDPVKNVNGELLGYGRHQTPNGAEIFDIYLSGDKQVEFYLYGWDTLFLLNKCMNVMEGEVELWVYNGDIMLKNGEVFPKNKWTWDKFKIGKDLPKAEKQARRDEVIIGIVNKLIEKKPYKKSSGDIF